MCGRSSRKTDLDDLGANMDGLYGLTGSRPTESRTYGSKVIGQNAKFLVIMPNCTKFNTELP